MRLIPSGPIKEAVAPWANFGFGFGISHFNSARVARSVVQARFPRAKKDSNIAKRPGVQTIQSPSASALGLKQTPGC